MRLHPAVLLTFSSVALLPAQDQPIIRVGTRMVQVDVVVRDKNAPVPGLTKDNFTLLDNGKPVQIAVFSVSSSRNAIRERAPLAAGLVSNRFNRDGERPATATILLLDRANTLPADQVFANQKVAKYLQNRGRKDRLGIYILGHGLRVIQDLTDDPGRLDRAIKYLKPEDARRLTADVKVDATGDAVTDAMVARALAGLEDIAMRDQATTTRDALIAIARHLGKVPGRKNLVWVSGSFRLFVQRDHETIDFTPEMRAAAQALNDANVAIYPVDARGLIGTPIGVSEQPGPQGPGPARDCAVCAPPGGPAGVDTMNFLAGATGGQAFYNTNGIEDSIRKAVDDAEITYTLGFYPPQDALDGTFHKLAVKVDRKSSDVRYRRNYYAARSDEAPPAPTVTQLIQDPLDATGIGLFAEASRDPAKADTLQVRATVDLHDLKLDHADGRYAGAVNVAFFIVGGKTIQNTTWKIDIPEADIAKFLESGTPVTASLPLAGPATDVRIVAQDPATQVVGSIRVPIRK